LRAVAQELNVAAIYPLWDDLFVDVGGSVRTELVGSAPDRQFVVEWRDVQFLGDSTQTLRLEVVLHEDGRIRTQYFTADPGTLRRGTSATVGIENADGSVAFQYSFSTPSLSSGRAVLYDFPPSGIVRGVVTESGSSGTPIAGAKLEVSS